MHPDAVDPRMLTAWLTARSIARGLPAPVADFGGWRVDTRSDAEVARWVFSRPGDGIARLARSITLPRHFLKLCGSAEALSGHLTRDWTLHPPSYFMQGNGQGHAATVPCGYTLDVTRHGATVTARIVAADGTLAASGHAAETADAFVYDQIVTAPGHRRKGLGRAVMAALGDARHARSGAELLVATEDGRALYADLGWVTISPYSTASISAPANAPAPTAPAAAPVR